MNNIKKEKRFRCFHLVLYDDDISHSCAIEYINNHFNFCGILHDKDFDINGVIKKPHYHYILYFDNARTITSLSKELDIKSNYINQEDLKRGLEYLIHKNNTDKYQYSIDEVFGNLKDKLLSYIGSSTIVEKSSVYLIINYINNSDILTLYDFLTWVVENDLWSFYRRSQVTFLKLLDEHNKYLKNK